MLPALKFVQGAVARKDFVPALTHFRIANRQVKGFNGSLAISSPIELDLDCSPKAVPFVKAIAACEGTIALHVAKNGKLVVQSGSFKAHVDCDDVANFPDIRPGGQSVKLPDSLLPALAALEPFIAEDASRPWACGVLFDGASAFATNNIVLCEYWLGFSFPGRVNIPGSAVKELLRVGQNPTRLQIQEGRLTFHYEDGRWISTQLFVPQWPNTAELLDRFLKAPAGPIDAEFWPALDQLLPFCDELQRCYFHGDRIATSANPELEGVSVAVKAPAGGVFNAKQLSNLRTIIKHISFEAYPEPVPFFGDRTRGIIVGIRTT